MDILVRFEDGTYCNVEVQKIGYAFPGERSACYSSDLLQNYIFIPLDIFRENVHNKGIKNKLDAWLVFLSMDEPERIIELISAYPEFKAMYEHVYSMCRNVEDAMGIFSEELKILDRNTVRYMVDEMQDTINEQKEQLKINRNTIETLKTQAEADKGIIDDLKTQAKSDKNMIEELQRKIAELQKEKK